MTHQPNNVSAADVLLPCPFCGGKPVVLGGGRNVHCGNEHCFMTSVWAKAETRELAEKCWNTRAAASTEAARQKPFGYFQSVKFGDAILCEQVAEQYKTNSDVFPLYAAPSPAAREAGDGVTLAAEQRIAIEAAISISADIEAECHDGSFLSDASVQALRALLREAGSRS